MPDSGYVMEDLQEPRGDLASRVLAMPTDTNPKGDIFGGWIMSLMDMAGKMSATTVANGRVVTVAVDRIVFREPVKVGDEWTRTELWDVGGGQTLTFEVTRASKVLASQVAFDRVVMEGVVYRPIGRRRVLSARLRGGIVREGVSDVGGASIRFVPPSELFYAGGPTTVRGFGRNEMGPVVFVYDTVIHTAGSDSTLQGLRSSPIGSAGLVLANIEVRTPTPLFGGRLGLSAFVDGGELWSFNGSTYLPGGFKVTPGIGFQVSTPLGPMRLTAAYNGYRSISGRLYEIQGGTLVLKNDDFTARSGRRTILSRLQWHFSVGVPF